MNVDSRNEQGGMSLEWVKEQLRALSAVEPPRRLREKLRAGIPCRSGSERVCERPVQRGMGILPMNHRQDADATRPHGQDARITSQTPSGASAKHTGQWLSTTGWAGIAATIVVFCSVLWLWTPTQPSVGPEPDAYSGLGVVLAVDYNNSLGQMLAADYNSVRPPDINALDSNSLQ